MAVVDNKKRNIVAIKDILPDVIKEISRSSSHEQLQLEKVWEDIAGPGKTGSLMNGFKDGTVYITVDSSARLYYWKLRRQTVLTRFQERRTDVKNIVFKIGKVT